MITTPEWMYLIGLAIFLLAVYIPSLVRYKQLGKMRMQTRPVDALLDILTWIGWQVLPPLAIFTRWFDWAAFTLPGWASWLGGGLLAAAILFIALAYAELGLSWSPKIEIIERHHLATGGIYTFIRHPVYAGMWLWSLANILLIQNIVAGFAMAAFFLPLYLLRVPREEAMLVDAFGDTYRQYMQRTGRIFPPIFRKKS